MHQLWNSRISLERVSAGLLRRMGESLLVLSRQLQDAEKASGRSERFSDYQGNHSFLTREPPAGRVGEKNGQSADSGKPHLDLMSKISPLHLAQRSYEAFAAGDRKFFEQHLAENLTFSSPLDVGLDRAGYFERCWPGSGQGQKFTFLRLVEHNDEVIVT